MPDEPNILNRQLGPLRVWQYGVLGSAGAGLFIMLNRDGKDQASPQLVPVAGPSAPGALNLTLVQLLETMQDALTKILAADEDPPEDDGGGPPPPPIVGTIVAAIRSLLVPFSGPDELRRQRDSLISAGAPDLADVFQRLLDGEINTIDALSQLAAILAISYNDIKAQIDALLSGDGIPPDEDGEPPPPDDEGGPPPPPPLNGELLALLVEAVLAAMSEAGKSPRTGRTRLSGASDALLVWASENGVATTANTPLWTIASTLNRINSPDPIGRINPVGAVAIITGAISSGFANYFAAVMRAVSGI